MSAAYEDLARRLQQLADILDEDAAEFDSQHTPNIVRAYERRYAARSIRQALARRRQP